MNCLQEIKYDIVLCSSVCGKKAAHLDFGFDKRQTRTCYFKFILLKDVGLFQSNLKIHGSMI